MRAWVWIDTADNLADPLTKLQADGTIALDNLQKALKKNYWRPSKEFIYNGVRVQPYGSYTVGSDTINTEDYKDESDGMLAWQ